MTVFVNSVSHSLYTTISSNATLVSSDVFVTLNEPFNTDPNKTPWVGVYFGDITLEPFRISQCDPWQAFYTMRVFVQGTSIDDGQSAHDELDRTLTEVITAINSNRTLDGTVRIVNGITVEPFQRDIDEEQWMFTNELIVQAEVEA